MRTVVIRYQTDDEGFLDSIAEPSDLYLTMLAKRLLLSDQESASLTVTSE